MLCGRNWISLNQMAILICSPCSFELPLVTAKLTNDLVVEDRGISIFAEIKSYGIADFQMTEDKSVRFVMEIEIGKVLVIDRHSLVFCHPGQSTLFLQVLQEFG